MTALRNTGDSGALFELSGEVSNNATWSEDIYFYENGAGMDLTGLDFELQLRDSVEDTSAAKLLSITGGELSLQLDSGSVRSILRIVVTAGTMSGYVGDYVADLVSQDDDDVVTHWAHGVLTFRRGPVTFS